SGLSTIGSISFGLALVAGRNLVPRPATGNTTVLTGIFDMDESSALECSPKNRRSIADRLTCAVVDALAQVFARLEMRHVLTRQRYGLAGLRIAALPRRTEMQGKTPESPNLYALPGRERIAHDFQQLLDGELDILRRQMLLLSRNDLNEFRFRHYRSVRITNHSGPRMRSGPPLRIHLIPQS